MRLWTIQNTTLLKSKSRSPLIADWSQTPVNWRFAYEWMASQYARRIGEELANAPFWCWHSCNGRIGSPPTVETINSLLGDWGYWAKKKRVLVIDVPDECALLSSYCRWNEAMDDGIGSGSHKIRPRKFLDMFDAPLIKYDFDDIQAVIPYIEKNWIVDVRPLPKALGNPDNFV